MTFEEFDKFQDDLIKECVKMKDTKGKEYGNSADRFGNFRRLSKSLSIPDYQIGYIYLAKHLDSIASYIKTGKEFSNESFRSRIIDSIVYLTLIAGMVEELNKYKDVQNGKTTV
jgi:hypothetical protein